MKETKNARFRRVAEARVNKIIRMLRLLGNCSGTNTYAYDADAVEQIFHGTADRTGSGEKAIL